MLILYYRVTSLLLLKELRLAENPIPYKKNSSVVKLSTGLYYSETFFAIDSIKQSLYQAFKKVQISRRFMRRKLLLVYNYH